MELIQLKCPNCSAELTANRELTKMTCNYCGAIVMVNDSASKVDRILNSVTSASERMLKANEEYQKKQLEIYNSPEAKKQRKDTLIILGIILGMSFLMIILGLVLAA